MTHAFISTNPGCNILPDLVPNSPRVRFGPRVWSRPKEGRWNCWGHALTRCGWPPRPCAPRTGDFPTLSGWEHGPTAPLTRPSRGRLKPSPAEADGSAWPSRAPERPAATDGGTGPQFGCQRFCELRQCIDFLLAGTPESCLRCLRLLTPGRWGRCAAVTQGVVLRQWRTVPCTHQLCKGS